MHAATKIRYAGLAFASSLGFSGPVLTQKKGHPKAA
jgi:hypothetical protein